MDWPLIRLDDCCQIKPPKAEAKKLLAEDELVSFVPMNNLGIDAKDLSLEEDKKLSAVSGSYTYFANGDVLLAKITPCFENGKLGIASGLTNGIGFGSSEFIVFRPDYRLIPDYLYYFLLQPSFRESGKAVMSGAVGHKRVPKEFVESTQIPLPSLTKQKRIVAIIDQAFADIDKARALTEQNLKNARELFESYLQQVFSQRGEGWVDSHLADICTFSSGGTPSKKNDEYWDGDIPWVSGRDMKSTQLFDTHLHISQKAVEETSTRLAPKGSLLALVRGMGLAHGAQVTELINDCSFNQDIRAIHPASNVNSRYLVFALRNQINTSDNVVSSAAHGTLKINMDELKNLIIPLPPINQQEQIVGAWNQLIESLTELENQYERKLAALEELRKSFLQKAFTGELTSCPDTKSLIFSALLVAYAFEKHEQQQRDKTFGHVKTQKILHLSESVAGIDLGREPYKDAAGPNDREHFEKVKCWANENAFFEFVERDTGGYQFVKLKNYDELLNSSSSTLKPFEKDLNQVIDLLLNKDKKQSEVFATVHAAWNNLIIENKDITEEGILFEAIDNWHADKKKLDKSLFVEAVQEIKDKNIVPNGCAKYVGFKGGLFK